MFIFFSHLLTISCEFSSAQFSRSVRTLWDPIDCSTPGFPVHHQLLEFTQTHVHWISDAIQPFHSLLSPSPSAFNLSQHQGLFQWISSLHQVAQGLEFQLQAPVSHWISTCQPLNQHLSAAWLVPISHLISTCQPVDQHLSATSFAPVSHFISNCQALRQPYKQLDH